MEIEKLELVAVDVKNRDQAVKLFSDLFGLTFTGYHELLDKGVKAEYRLTEHADRAYEGTKRKSSLDRTGIFEIVESDPPVEKEGLRAIHFKVADLEQAKAEMKEKGIRLTKEITVGGMKEVIFSPDDLHGIRLCFLEYDAPSLVDAMLQK